MSHQLREFVIIFIARLLSVFYPVTCWALRRCHLEWHPRKWSNAELRRWGVLFEGDVINVSGWKDEDRQDGDKYKNYFPRKASYLISNIEGHSGLSGVEGEIYLDLTKELPDELCGRFDVVFNHTTLEHIYDVHTAVANLCEMTKDILVLVVPVLQHMHFAAGSYLDYWRFTPFSMEILLREHGLEVVYWSNNENPVYAQYLFVIASKRPEKWRLFFPDPVPLTQENAPGYSWYGWCKKGFCK